MRLRPVTAAVAAGFVLAATATASAQASAPADRIYLHANFGFQPSSIDVTQRASIAVYDEDAQVEARFNTETGPMFDLGGGFRVTGQFFVGASFTQANDTASTTVAGSIPHPLFFGQPRPASVTVDGVDHKESALHLQAAYRFAISPRIDVTVSGGPSFFWVTQGIVTDLDVSETSPPDYGTVSLTGVEVTDESDSPIGFNVGADVTYMFSDRLGAGGFLRFTGATATIATEQGEVEVDAGGLQIGGGIRFRF